MRSAVLALVLLAAILPLPPAQAASWSVDAMVTVTSATTADYTWRIGLSTPTILTLPMPDDSAFVEARDVDGKLLTASVADENVTVTTGSKPFVLKFALTGTTDGPFSTFAAQVASDTDSPVTVGIALPEGWSFAGYRDSGDRAPDSTGVFRGDGPAYVQYLALQPDHTDPGPTSGVSGRVVRREGTAELTATGATWTLVTTYDTEIYSRSWEIHVPDGATVTSATSPFGALQTTREGDLLHVTTPYPVGFHLGARSFTVEMALAPPTVQGGAFREANLSVRAAEDDDVRIVATLADGLRYTGTHMAGGVETSPLTYRATGPMSVGIAFLPPAEPGHVQFEEGLFVVDAPVALEAAARATARNASELLPRASSFVYDADDTRPFFVAYTEANIFGWEEGFYSNGLNTIAIRAKTLEDAADGAAHLVPVGVLVHEATHGLIDRRLPDAPRNLSFLHEGLARLAETHLEAYFPTDEILDCNGLSCSRHSARPSAETVQDFHQASTLFDVTWRASAVESDTLRGELYDYSGLVLHAFEQRAPPGALPNALAHVAAQTFDGSASADSQRLLDLFLLNAPGTSAPAFLYPGREAAGLAADEFAYCMGTLVAPAYPWEDTRRPSGGCPATGYGPGGALPTPPTPVGTTPLPADPTPGETPTPSSPIRAPVATTPAPIRDTPGEVPGAEVDPRDDAPSDVEITAIPAPGIALVALAVGALALRTRGRSR